MTSGAEIYVMNKINDLASRYGLSPLDTDFHLLFKSRKDELPPGQDICCYTLSMSDYGDEKMQEKLHRIAQMLGLDADRHAAFGELEELSDLVDLALKQAPRARSR